jgi:hypothetical protein
MSDAIIPYRREKTLFLKTGEDVTGYPLIKGAFFEESDEFVGSYSLSGRALALSLKIG